MMMVEVEIEVEVGNLQIEGNKNIKLLNTHKVRRTEQCVFNQLSAGGHTERQSEGHTDTVTDTQ